MGKRDPRIDAYIEKSAGFAQPILHHLREVVHAACPDVQETMKWSFPHFDYKGMMCGMASFKEHCTFGFWKGSLIVNNNGKNLDDAMGQFGRITRVGDLPSKKILTGYIKEAMRLNDEGVKLPAKAKTVKPDLVVPAYVTDALEENELALATFERFSPSHKREYVEWITEAKGEATRLRRLAQALEMMAEGKSKNWKYEKC